MWRLVRDWIDQDIILFLIMAFKPTISMTSKLFSKITTDKPTITMAKILGFHDRGSRSTNVKYNEVLHQQLNINNSLNLEIEIHLRSPLTQINYAIQQKMIFCTPSILQMTIGGCLIKMLIKVDTFKEKYI